MIKFNYLVDKTRSTLNSEDKTYDSTAFDYSVDWDILKGRPLMVTAKRQSWEVWNGFSGCDQVATIADRLISIAWKFPTVFHIL